MEEETVEEEENMNTLTTKRLALREFTVSDAGSIVKHINNIKVSGNLIVVPHPITVQEVTALIEHAKKDDKKNPAEYHFGITLKGKDEVIGSIRLEKFDIFRETASLGYWLGEDYWRQGIMTEAAIAIIDFGFETLKLRRINVSAFVENKASNSLIRKLGFIHEGTSRGKVRSLATKVVHDEHDYGLLREDWHKHRRTLS
jgi:ribosomal-protein-alanine N-acetyltransferase